MLGGRGSGIDANLARLRITCRRQAAAPHFNADASVSILMNKILRFDASEVEAVGKKIRICSVSYNSAVHKYARARLIDIARGDAINNLSPIHPQFPE